MTVHESVEDAIGDTPLFRLNRMTEGIAAPVYAKAEFLGVGGSVKDRAALSMVRAAERDGLLRPGGTIVEATSGNTGIGLAIVGRRRGYRVVAVLSDRSAVEKSDILRAYGAEVVLASGSLPREHPDHLANVARRIAEETPGAWHADQYNNPANPDAHVRTTGPEIWEQTKGRITHFVAGVGTGGTITGTGAFLKEVSGGVVTVVGADPQTSVYSGGDGSPYFVESIGHFLHPDTQEDAWPESFHPAGVDRFERVPDRESLLTARLLAREEGLLAGPSSGTAVAAALRTARDLGPDDLVVVLLPDSGRSYLSKVHSDAWLRGWGFLEEPDDGSGGAGPTLRSLLAPAPGGRAEPLRTVPGDATVGEALEILRGVPGAVAPVVLPRRVRAYGVSASEVLGSVDAEVLGAATAADAGRAGRPLGELVSPALPTVGVGESPADALRALGDHHPAVLVLIDGRAAHLLPRAHLPRAHLPGV